MSEGIWVYVFMAIVGMMMCAIFFTIGVIIGGIREHKADSESNNGTIRGRHNDLSDSCTANERTCSCGMGNDNKEICGRSDIRRNRIHVGQIRRITPEEQIIVLEYFQIGATSYEKAVLAEVIKQIELESKYEGDDGK